MSKTKSLNGIINIYKEQDYTSFDVVAKLRRILNFKKIGHTGTLDPMATGVLPICIGKSTKVVELLTNKSKTYKATMVFGIDTDTQDITGTVLSENEIYPDLEMVKSSMVTFIGEYHQVPPMYSALKVNGKKLYELARQGIEVEREARVLQIHNISNIVQIDERHYSFVVSCSKGTYIRTLIVDIAAKLGAIATMTALERTEVEPFRIEDSLTLEQVEALVLEGKIDDILMPVDSLFKDLPQISTLEEEDKWLYNGSKFQLPFCGYITDKVDECLRLCDSKGQFIAIYKTTRKDGKMQIKPYKMFH